MASAAATIIDGGFLAKAMAADTINVGVLFSLTGGLTIIEKSLHDATMMAVSEINASGGVLGKQVHAIEENGASDPKTYNEKASKLVIEDRVTTVFGCYTSASRKAVLPIFGKRNAMLFYPTSYEGYECSKNVVYTGAVPNQQLSNFIPLAAQPGGGAHHRAYRTKHALRSQGQPLLRHAREGPRRGGRKSHELSDEQIPRHLAV